VVPADDLLDVDDHTETLLSLLANERQRCFAHCDFSVVLFSDDETDVQHFVIILDDATSADQLDTA